MAAIALVEDEPDSREMVARGLRRLGHRVEVFPDGAEAIARIAADTEVVVTDLVMPKADGLDLLRHLLETRHRAARIVVTSFADKDRAVAALNLGANYLLEKPFLVPALDEVIGRVLATRGDPASIDEIFTRQLTALPVGERDRGMIVLVLKGLANADIGAQFGITEQAVKSALFTIYRKLGISSRGELFHLIFPI